MANSKVPPQSGEIHRTLLQHAGDISQLREHVNELLSKEKRVSSALASLRQRLDAFLSTFSRDGYKSTDQRLLARALAEEAQIFDKLGYDVGTVSSTFVLALAALLDGRHYAALDRFEQFIDSAPLGHSNVRDAVKSMNQSMARDECGFGSAR